jgi:3-deoxy-D-manno-octulosonic-acid transferase
MSQGPAIAAQFQQSGWSSRYRSDDEEPEEDVQVYIADTDGEMGLWYRLAPITFVGSTLIEAGTCPDPYEPAALGSAILYGPHTGLRESVFDRISAAGAARRVGSAAALGEAVSELLSPDKAAEMAHKAWQVTSRGAEVTDRVIELLQDALDESPN